MIIRKMLSTIKFNKTGETNTTNVMHTYQQLISICRQRFTGVSARTKTATCMIITNTLLLCSPPSFADAFNKDIERLFLEPAPVLTPDELNAIKLSKQWQAAKKSKRQPAPIMDAAGRLNFVYGTFQPTIVCAVMQVCDLALEEGENINKVNIGDTVRWILEPAITGAGENQRVHVLIKPLDSALDTNLFIATDKRQYNIKLVSTREDYMAQVGFIYPEKALAKFEQLQRIERNERVVNTIPETKEYIGDLNFDYQISGDKELRPVRVYNNGIKTVIEMKDTITNNEAPSLLIIREGKGLFGTSLFKAEQTVMAQYHIKNTRFIVDGVFEQAMLVTGAGKFQRKVTIKRN